MMSIKDFKRILRTLTEDIDEKLKLSVCLRNGTYMLSELVR